MGSAPITGGSRAGGCADREACRGAELTASSVWRTASLSHSVCSGIQLLRVDRHRSATSTALQKHTASHDLTVTSL